MKGRRWIWWVSGAVLVVALLSLALAKSRWGPGVWGMASSVMMPLQPADIAHAKTFEHPQYRLRYPGNWSIMRGEQPETVLMIGAPGQDSVTIFLFPPAIKSNMMKTLELSYSMLVFGAREVPFRTWGAQHGEGKELVGRFVFIPTRVRLFVADSFAVAEIRHGTAEALNGPGFALIADSFARSN
jgi:hypothetical protein